MCWCLAVFVLLVCSCCCASGVFSSLWMATLAYVTSLRARMFLYSYVLGVWPCVSVVSSLCAVCSCGVHCSSTLAPGWVRLPVESYSAEADASGVCCCVVLWFCARSENMPWTAVHACVVCLYDARAWHLPLVLVPSPLLGLQPQWLALSVF